MTTRFTVCRCMLATVLVVAGCGGEEKLPGSENVKGPQGESKYEKLMPAGKIGLSSEKPAVAIIPDPPTADDVLRAVPSGTAGAVVWRWERNGKVIEGAASPSLPKGSVARGDKVAAILSANGNEVRAEAVIANSPPRMISVTFTPDKMWKGLDITAVPRAVDADGDNITFHYQWLINRQEVPAENSAMLRGDRVKPGDLVAVKVTATDGQENSKPFFAAPQTGKNTPPKFTSIPVTTFEGYVYNYQAAAEDADSDNLTYSLVSAPQGMTIDGKSGKIEWKLTKESAGTHPVEIVVKDGTWEVSQKFTLNISMRTKEKAE